MGVIIGVLVGYALGAKAGPDGWAEIEEAWHTIYTSEEVRDLVAVGVSMARELVERRTDVIAAILGGEPHEASRLKAA